MADDSYKIEFESNLNETIKHVVEGTPPDFEAAIRSELAALEGEGDIPGSTGNPAPTVSNGTQNLQGGGGGVDQLGSDEAFGQGKKFGDPGSGYGPAGPQAVNWNSILAKGAADANSAPPLISNFSQTASDVNSAPPLVNSFAQTASLGQEMAGNLSNALSKIGQLGEVAAGGLEAIAVASGPIGLALTGFTLALSAATKVVDSTFKALASSWEDISPRIAMAQGQSEAELTAHKLRTEYRVGAEVAGVTEARTDLQETFMNLSATVIQIIGPSLSFMMETLSMLLEIINGILVGVGDVIELLNMILRPIISLMKIVHRWFANNDDSLRGPEQGDVFNFLLTKGIPEDILKIHYKDYQNTQRPRSYLVDI